MRPTPSMSIRFAIALAAALAIGAASTALAGEHAPVRHHRHARIIERPTPLAAFSGARLVTHPAWTFACEGAYGPNRGKALNNLGPGYSPALFVPGVRWL